MPNQNPEPVNRNASPEARALLRQLQELSGKGILSGQHNNPGAISKFTDEVHEVTGKFPAVWGQDFGFSAEEWDGIQYRDEIVREAIRQHKAGSIVTLMWHAVPPTKDEPGTFKVDVCNGPLPDKEWKALLTPGSEVHRHWQSQVDVIAELLKRIQNENIPVLWRPYHEMNGDWFWWGAKTGEYGYARLYRQLYDYLTQEHGLNNLLWVWNANEPNAKAGLYVDFYPGSDVVDVLATDVYGAKYDQAAYEELVALAGDRLVALGEIGEVPTPELLKAQRRYVWFMIWGGFLKENKPEAIERLFTHQWVRHRCA